MSKLLQIVIALGVGMGWAGAPARAQVNTEKLRTKKVRGGWHGYFEGALDWQTGNTELLDAGMGARLEYNHGVHSPFLQGAYSLGQKSGQKYVHNGFLHARWPAMWHRRVGSELFSQMQFDDFKKLKMRTLVGAGVRVAAVLHKIVELYVGTGYMFEYEQLDLEGADPLDPHPGQTYHHRWTSYLSVRVDVSKWLKLTNIAYVQPRFDKFSDVRILEDLSLVFTVYKSLKLVLTFILQYDSDPISIVAKLDTKTITKLRFVF